MGSPVTLGNEPLERRPDGLCAWAAENEFRRGIEQDYALLLVHSDDRVHR